MNHYRLSICIPTYNRAEYIGDTLSNITSQPLQEVEIVILDGASSDNTATVVNGFQERFPNISYHRETQNGGVDLDLAKAVAAARGEYCWLMSSDDFIAEGAIQRVLSEIELGFAIYSCSIVACTKGMVPFTTMHWFPPKMGDCVFDFSREADVIEYLEKAESIGALFSYMPSIVVRRSDWNRVSGSEEFYGSCYAHVFTLFSILQMPNKVKYISTPLLLTRFGNDAATARGFWKRIMLDFDGYIAFGERLWPNNHRLRQAFLDVLRRSHPWYRLIRVRSLASVEQWRMTQSRLRIVGYSSATILVCNYCGSLRSLVSLAFRVRKLLRPI
ncbi:MAG TPA: glycosyltransferase family 2 protein [Nitrososphaera sp.]|nr:glycosyltransferase family 2 protein [Nitrososphaera sp.]